MTNSFNCTYIDRDTQPHVKTSPTQEAWSEKQARATLTLLKATTKTQANSPATMSLGRHLASHREGAGPAALGGRGGGGGEAISATLLGAVDWTAQRSLLLFSVAVSVAGLFRRGGRREEVGGGEAEKGKGGEEDA